MATVAVVHRSSGNLVSGDQNSLVPDHALQYAGHYVLTERTHDIITQAVDAMLPGLISKAVSEYVTPERITAFASTEVLHHMRNQVRKQIEEAMSGIKAPAQLEKPGTDGR